MAKFAYSAIDPTGAEIEGITKADTIGSARAFLVEQNLFPIKIEESRGMLDFELTQGEGQEEEPDELHPPAGGVREGRHPDHRRARRRSATRRPTSPCAGRSRGMVDDLRNGGLLSAAAAQHPEVFPNYYIGILQVGRAHRPARRVAREPRRLPRARDRDPRQGRRRPRLPDGRHGAWRSSRSLILAGYVLPQFKPLFEELDADLPLPTRMMLFFARFFTDLWYITADSSSLFIAVDGVPVHAPDGQGALKQRMMLKIPIIKGIVEYAHPRALLPHPAARCCRPACAIPSAMETTTEATANIVYREQLEIARQQMLEGGGFTQPLIETELFPGAATPDVQGRRGDRNARPAARGRERVLRP